MPVSSIGALGLSHTTTLRSICRLSEGIETVVGGDTVSNQPTLGALPSPSARNDVIAYTVP